MSRPDAVVAEKGRKVQKKGQRFDILHFQLVSFCSRFACKRRTRSRSRNTEGNASLMKGIILMKAQTNYSHKQFPH